MKKEGLYNDFFNTLKTNAPKGKPQNMEYLDGRRFCCAEKLQEVYSRANVVSNRAFREVAKFVVNTTAHRRPLEKQYFTAIADYSDNDYLKEEFGIEYKRPEEMHSIDSFFRYLTNLDSISTDSKFFTEIVIPMPVTLKAEHQNYNEKMLNNLLSSNFIEHKTNNDQVPIDLHYKKTDDLGKLIDKKLSLLLMLNCIHTYSYLRQHYEKNGFL